MQPAPESFTVDGIAIAQQIAGSGVEGKGFDHLLHSPLSGWASGDIEVKHKRQENDVACYVSSYPHWQNPNAEEPMQVYRYAVEADSL